MSEPEVIDNRGLGKRIKHNISPRLFRAITKVYNVGAAVIPSSALYAFAGATRSRKFPYKLIQDGDTVVQIGAPRDLLAAGRSRAVHFMRLVGAGKVVVIEPDPHSFAALEAFVAASGLRGKAVLIQGAVWAEPGEKVFLSSETHPAANLLADAKEISTALLRERGYRQFPVRVDTLDSFLRQSRVGLPKLVSITANGAELEILKGMQELLRDRVPYISLASTGPGYVEHMQHLGYRYVATDDRGYTFAAS